MQQLGDRFRQFSAVHCNLITTPITTICFGKLLPNYFTITTKLLRHYYVITTEQLLPHYYLITTSLLLHYYLITT